MSEDDRFNAIGAGSRSSVSAQPVPRQSSSRPAHPVQPESNRIKTGNLETGGDDAVEAIESVFNRRDARALKHYRRRLNLTVFAVALGPVAVVLLATQVVVFPQGGLRGSLLIVVELVVLTLALAVGFLQMGRSHRLWIKERLRAEIVRREGFLLRVRVGPYLNLSEGALIEKVRERLVTLDSDVNDPVALLPMHDESGNWRDALEDGRDDGGPGTTPDLAQNLDTYLTRRTKLQREWFSRYSRILSRRARFYENSARLILLLALVIAALHLAFLAAGKTEGFGHALLIIVAMAAPAIGSAFVGLQSLSGSQRLSRSYVFFAHELERFEKLFRRVQARLQQSGTADEQLQLQFKRGVLETEELLSREMHVWWLIMHTEAPRAAA